MKSYRKLYIISLLFFLFLNLGIEVTANKTTLAGSDLAYKNFVELSGLFPTPRSIKDLVSFPDGSTGSGMTPLSLISDRIYEKGESWNNIQEVDDKQLHRLMDEADHFRILENPFLADKEGKFMENDKLPSESIEDMERRNEFWKMIYSTLLKTIEKDNLSLNNKIAYDLFKHELEHILKSYEFNTFLFSEAFYNNLIGLHNRAPMATKGDYENYIKRLKAIPVYFEQHIERFRKGIETGFIIPRVLFQSEDSNYGIHRQIVDSAEESDFYEPFSNFPSTISQKDQEYLKREGQRVIIESVISSFLKLKEFLENEYIPYTRESIGISELPGGRQYYDHLINYHTTLSVSAEDVYKTGLEEVKRIQEEMLEVMNELKFEGSMQDFFEFLRTDSRFYVSDPIDLLKEASYLAKKIDGKLPEIFHLNSLPRRPYGVEPVPDHLAPRYTGGRYSLGGKKKAGFFLVNTYDLPSRPLFTLEALLYHEAVPGHHLEMALSQELEDAPRRFGRINAYSEGWALYAERLGLEVGLYENPYSNFGRLTYEMWRACRLIVDTGIHAFGWSKEEVVEFLTKNTALSHLEVDTETDRYIRDAGQALSYKIGELEIRELRELAEKTLGNKFDIRDFHHAVLKKGPVLLPELEKQVREYIQETLCTD